MLAKLKVCIFIFIVSPSLAFASANATSTCETLSGLTSDYIRKALTTFSPDVLGKPADLWTYDDFMNLQQNAIACDGFPPNVASDGQVDAKRWQYDLIEASKEVLAYSAITLSIHEAYKPLWTWGDIPSCISIVDWKKDPVWFSDNSKEIFGEDIRELDYKERAYIGGLAEACLPVSKKVLSSNGIEESKAEAIVSDIKKSIERENLADQEDPSKLAEAFHVYKDGKRIPMSYVGPTARKWIDFANKFEMTNRSMRTEDLITLTKWVEMTSDDTVESPDTLYAKAMRRVISKRMFGRD